MSEDSCKICKDVYEQPCRFLKWAVSIIGLLATAAILVITNLISSNKDLEKNYNQLNAWQQKTDYIIQDQRQIFNDIKIDIKEIKNELKRAATK